MLGPIELHATGDPRPEQTYQRRLDHVLAVEEIVVVGFVLAHMNAAADLRQDHQAKVLVFQIDGLVLLIDLLVGKPVGKGVRIYLSTAALINALVEKHGIAVGRGTG